MFNRLVSEFESALSELIATNREQIVAAMHSGYDSGAPVEAIAFGVFPWYDSMELSFGNKQDYLERTTQLGDWQHYSICSSLRSPADPIATAVASMVQFYMGDEDDDDEQENESQIRANVIFFAAAKALLSTEFWRVLNPVRMSVLEELTAAGRGTGFTEFEMRQIGGGFPSLDCVVTDGDATIRANYCELHKAIELLGEYSDEVLAALA